MNVGILGTGFIVPVFIEESKRYPEYHLVGAWGRHPEKLDKVKDEFEYVTDDLEKLLSDPSIDVIYVALPNGLHFEYAMKALEHGKHVMVEKPFTVNTSDAKKLFEYGKEHNLLVFEAIMTSHIPTYKKMVELKDQLGDIKIIDANFSQYSRRYERFKNGESVPVFNKDLAGGALLDLNVYNIRFMIGMFGEPKDVKYFANVENGVDTSGVLILDYGTFKAKLIAGKDCRAECHVTVQGDLGYIKCNATASRCSNFDFVLNGKEKETYAEPDSEFVGWKYELKEFLDIYNNKDLPRIEELAKLSMSEIGIIEKALISADIKY